jgi:hypothetical protein
MINAPSEKRKKQSKHGTGGWKMARLIDVDANISERKWTEEIPVLELVFNEEEGTWEERHKPYITVEIETEEDYALLQKAIDHYHKHGRWEWDIEDIYRCSNCHEKSHVKEVMGQPDWDYCPNCGADMRECDGNEQTDMPVEAV